MEHAWNPQTLRDIFSPVLQMTDEQLKNIPYLQVRENKSGPGWEAVTGFCCLGGCDMNVYSFQSERDALLFAALLKVVGYQPPHNIACEKCYQEYMTEQTKGGIDSYAE